MSFLSQLSWRYATKKFDVTKPISEDQLKQVLNAIRMAPTSLGIQPFHVTVVKSDAIKAQLAAAGYNQVQFTTATYVLVFSGRTDVAARGKKMIDDLLSFGAPKDKMEVYGNMINGLDAGFTSEEQRAGWAKHQAYITLGFGLAAAAELGIDSCPMEGFDRDAFKKILELPENHYPTAVLTLGMRASDDIAHEKYRFPESDLFGEIK